jgi:hypothetical protein
MKIKRPLKRIHRGSCFRDFLNEQGILGEVKARAVKQAFLLKQISVESLPVLEEKLLKTSESLDTGRGVAGEQVFARLRQRIKSRHQNA